MEVLNHWEYWMLLGFMGLGTLLMLTASLGVLRMTNALARMHAAGLGSSLGILLLLLATGYYFQFMGNHEKGSLLLMVALGFLLLVTNPIATTAMSRAVMRSSPDNDRQYLALDEYAVGKRLTVPVPSEPNTMIYVDRRGWDSSKWETYDRDVIPLWVADMDFRSPDPIIKALQVRAAHGIFGYGATEEAVGEWFCTHLLERYDWHVTPDQLVFLPGLVSGLNLVVRAIGRPGSGVMTHEPVYPPFLVAPGLQDRKLQSVPMPHDHNGGLLHFRLDMERFRAVADDSTALFLLCNPHNPTGRSLARHELLELAEFCLNRSIVICSDEIHCDLMHEGRRHLPIASLEPEIADSTITLMAPSKTYNMPGLGCSVAVVPNPALRTLVQQAAMGIVPHVNVMGYAAALAAYSHADCRTWLEELLRTLTANRDYMEQALLAAFPGVRTTRPEGTYLSWVDFGAVVENPYRFFLNHARVALSEGSRYHTTGGHTWARINLGTSQSLLEEAVARMQAAVAQHQGS
ncbi:MAG: putative C-S lyase [Caldilineaceae bacterium SB0664_bin_22]|nr:putative C-S lyase [Caldilineaceae bacterium SB0664_bin_22]MYC62052.1 putative C-S lyase [Caldilineaceae bacterium SB0661_bin_34]